MGMFGGYVWKFLGFAGILFIDWKIASKKLSQNHLFITTIFFAAFFSKAGFKRSLNIRTPFKKTLNEKQSNLEKEMYGSISLYSKFFSPGAGRNVHKHTFTS